MQAKHPILMLTVALTGLVLAGCGTTRVDPRLMAEANRPMADASILLSESAQRAATAQEQLVRIQTARTLPAPAPVNETLAGVPDELRRPTTIEWTGPGDEAARRVSTIVGYEFRVVGNPPATLPMVNVSMQGVPAVKALEDIGNQVQPFAQIVVDANLRRIEYRYLVVAGGQAPGASRPSMSK